MTCLPKEHWKIYPVRTCERIIAHAEYRSSHGWKPSMLIGRYRKPKRLLKAAKKIAVQRRRHAEWLGRVYWANREFERSDRSWKGNLGSSHGHRDDEWGTIRGWEELVRIAGSEDNEWRLYIIHIKRVEPCPGGHNFARDGFMPEVRSGNRSGPEAPTKVFPGYGKVVYDQALELGFVLLDQAVRKGEEQVRQKKSVREKP